MYGVSSNGKDAIGKIVETIFDRIALQFIGDLPRFKDKKRLVISSQPHFGLLHLFVQAMANKTPNSLEKGFLRGLLESSNGYIESLKNKTTSNVVERVDGIAREAKIQKRSLTEEEVQDIIGQELKKARAHLQTIVEAESTKLRNLGTMMDISRVASSVGDEDPTVFFVVIRDNVTCKECIRLHLTDNGTPRLWKFSELKQGYHKRGEENPSAFGLHPHCRCTMAYLTRGFSFDKKGRLSYKEEGFDAYAEQREA
jgi:hypothetical protein